MQYLHPCSFCNESTHTERKCPELVAPLREEDIQKPAGADLMAVVVMKMNHSRRILFI